MEHDKSSGDRADAELVVHHSRKVADHLAGLFLIFFIGLLTAGVWLTIADSDIDWNSRGQVERFMIFAGGALFVVLVARAINTLAQTLFGDERLSFTEDALIHSVALFGFRRRSRYLRQHIGPISYLPYKKVGSGKYAVHRPSQIYVPYMSRFKRLALDIDDEEGARILAFLRDVGGFEIAENESVSR
ncbi:MAG: hypothetical protein JJ908_08720 [Rhizobiales bacterium]|nr:hypothetical protein [Hyphomicrobiales bacterium]MBO6697306.1 hypothetical protein [Hyphomicrobiales bacterium]MBO6736439.1 hypothetical protein [Hyphomicrobiales bacterium]MBO6912909.1 hypothetical protein [Hyphomicrobiales bacterium]MBO6954077.1 hypothetical protein [Hyphomicrobiales bacterium]